MSREVIPSGHAPWPQDIEDVLRRPDGSFDIAAYANRAHRERAVVITASAGEGIRRLREMMSGVRAGLAPAARCGPASGKHHAAARR